MALQKQEVELRKEEVNLYREEAPNQIIKFFMFSCIFKFIMLFFQEQLCMQQRGDEKKQPNDDANAATTTADVYSYDEYIQ